ncbi:bifunctional 2-C-methyl-D-erythritol 4-phosphate cytidylyltransferase/2-C-methyl-D-erythritol 2,4-cyclodiphosphate synthase [Micavibrio aeruginosavorus]|uniref:Bifunctional enzyme IspD/IspF n=1 Tax=Micavibrio aeruginosavorus EPB TaxID=349215 RepID=M4VFA0_9BACT|nr:bifunctional 2-C-methyl-D-erythritol 4-phosphate cytidylyltransferase/2-C-methyl-D-erythritol 2,4-cyclodiphosphate synthase [Micavibrio aeruginosavorus]AGH98032.1 2-C-methyl-D-erythritol 4-phosphate cytidylyltransferase / 2-C-methyl-D-erythritol 2,4-cyclodiphosphate synthase [Micavibrio aeruginosavorus EPB]
MESMNKPQKNADFTPLPFTLIVVAAGTGTRIGGEIPKQYQRINGKTLLRHTLDRALKLPGLRDIRVVINADHSDPYHDAVHGLNLPPPIIGGNSRKESVYNGIKSITEAGPKDVILIHDAARPFLDTESILALVHKAHESGAATLAVPVADTVARDNNESLDHIVDRSGLWAIQTPQAFHYDLIKRAHDQFQTTDHFTDDTGLVAALGQTVHIVPGTRQNFKITTADDMTMAKALLSQPMETRTGFGFDVHALTAPGAGSGLIHLGGVAIPHNRSLIGHSDADVGLHALTDAILSTIAAGDIGTHFPPSDPQWKGADSTIFLKKSVDLIHEKNGVITLLDLTFLCEEPKIGPHREAMQGCIHRVTGVAKHRISIKATTTEKLGFTGRGEGIAAQAIATVQFPAEDI